MIFRKDKGNGEVSQTTDRERVIGRIAGHLGVHKSTVEEVLRRSSESTPLDTAFALYWEGK